MHFSQTWYSFMLAEITDVMTEEERKEPGGMQSVLRKHARGEKTIIVH